LKTEKKMKNKILIGALLVGTASVATVARASETCASAGTGFYAGLSLGMANTNTKYTRDSEGNLASTDAATKRDSLNFGKAGGLFGIVTGYNVDCGGGLVAGVELSAGMDTTKNENKVNDVLPEIFNSNRAVNNFVTDTRGSFTTTKLKRSSYYGLSGRLGYKMSSSTLVYGKLGIEFGKWTAEVIPSQDIEENDAPASMGPTPLSDDQLKKMKETKKRGKNSASLVLGAGVENYLSQNVSVRGEYSYAFSPKIDIEQDTSLLHNKVYNGNKLTHKFKTSQHRVQVAVVWHF